MQGMTLYEYYIIYPEGESLEIPSALPAACLLDLNGNPIKPPLPTNKMIAYQIAGKRTREERGTVKIFYILEQLNAQELLDYVY